MRKAKFRRGTSSPRLSSDLAGEGKVPAHRMTEKFPDLPGPDLVCSFWVGTGATFWGRGLPQPVAGMQMDMQG